MLIRQKEDWCPVLRKNFKVDHIYLGRWTLNDVIPLLQKGKNVWSASTWDAQLDNISNLELSKLLMEFYFMEITNILNV